MFPVVLDEVQRKPYFRKILGLDRANLIGYWPMWEPSGGVAEDLSPEGNDGAYTGVTLGQPGIGDGRTCPLWDGTGDFNNYYSVDLNADLDPDEITMLIWFKVSGVGVWTDGVFRYIFRFRTDTDNRHWLAKSSVNNTLQWHHSAGGITNVINIGGHSETDWVHLAFTVSLSNNEAKYYEDGVQVGITETGIGTWVGDLASTFAIIGANNTAGANSFDGNIAHAALLKTALPAGKILQAARV